MDFIFTNSEEFKIIKLLVKALNIKVSDYTIKQKIAIQPFNIPVLNIVNTLPDLNIDAISLQLDKKEFNRINEFTFPFIGLLSIKGKEQCAVISKFDNDYVHYETSNERVVAKWDNFIKVWNGYSLLIFPQVDAADKHFQANNPKEQRDKAIKIGIVVLGICTWLGMGYYLYRSSTLLSFCLWHLKLLGVIISIFLIAHDINTEGSFVNRICSIGKNDCSKILNSNEGKLFGQISWSDLGLVYFMGTSLMLVLYNAPI